jgi:hypothetical protein
MTTQQLRHLILVAVIVFQALAGSLASAAPMLSAADRAHCEPDVMTMHGADSMGSGVGYDAHGMPMAGTSVPDSNAEHACESGCCCPSACASAAAILPQAVLWQGNNTAAAFVLMTTPPTDLRVANLLRPPISA